jgi:hypothetical protein
VPPRASLMVRKRRGKRYTRVIATLARARREIR